jgi:hypothetical protein
VRRRCFALVQCAVLTNSGLLADTSTISRYVSVMWRYGADFSGGPVTAQNSRTDTDSVYSLLYYHTCGTVTAHTVETRPHRMAQ